MGLFSKKNAEPVVHEPVARRVHVPADAREVASHLAAYSRLWSPKRAEQHEVMTGLSGGWTAIRLPDAVHPWQLHNLASWMLDCPGLQDGDVIAESGAGPGHAGYRLVRDPEVPDSLCGWDDEGSGWTVSVPDNEIVRGEDVPVSRAFPAPSDYREWQPVVVSLEDPGRRMNEGNRHSIASRRKLIERSPVWF